MATTISFLGDLIQSITDTGRGLIERVRRSPDVADGKGLILLARDLLSRRGEASGVALARHILDRYEALSKAEKQVFLREVAVHFGPDHERLEKAMEAYQAAPTRATMVAVHHAAEPLSQELIRRLNLAPGGTHALVRMREDLFEAMEGVPALESLDQDFAHLFASWFNRGFLVLRRIDWTTPAHLLEKIIQYEAVHAISGFYDLRQRLAPPDRRCFAFFHPALIDEPLIFVEVALTDAIPEAIEPILADERVHLPLKEANTAVFYSISNCQKGLRGVSFGNFLIKQVVEDLKRDAPSLKTFVTLSPVPGFAVWLDRERKADASEFIPEMDKVALAALDNPDWAASADIREALRKPLAGAAAAYFLKARSASGRPIDPVARFHLGNGARLEKLDLYGDLSTKGLRQSKGLMVNYLYDLDAIERNHEAYANQREVVASSAVKKALRVERSPRSLVPIEN